ncbi:aldo/keto reductase family domain-containing protein [Ditylenchus destructor]|uniref:Aldo/keto reductase family domain-containing protein n=1 Tax=Ditylenchus destructor TaxID=166010 RepID=A0AAD4MME6_9BILA|nr:aldo/keto reductase family domain-containing protein [Ditylenchus destructor]KAI1698657.1 aldo/keto reductase family domain-containing protein [Ditylenchus destructor]
MAVNTGSITLSNGVKLPRLGLGTAFPGSPQEFKIALRAALDTGYRYIDTATAYKNEDVIGEVLQEYFDAGKLKREDVFITTKLPYTGHREVDYHLKKSLENLKLDYVDLYLIHKPVPSQLVTTLDENMEEVDRKFIPDLIPLIDTWRELEKHYKAGTVKAIGVSNFNGKQLRDIHDQAEIKPHNLQVELHLLNPQHELVALCKKLNVSVTSYATLGSPGTPFFRGGVQANIFEHELVKEMAKKYEKSPAQIILRQMMQRGVSVIPKSTNPTRIQGNIDVFDFQISRKDMKKFDEITDRIRLFPFQVNRHHPWHPFQDEFKA